MQTITKDIIGNAIWICLWLFGYCFSLFSCCINISKFITSIIDINWSTHKRSAESKKSRNRKVKDHKRKRKGLVKNIKEYAAKDHFIETLQCKVNNELFGQRNLASSALYNKASVVIRASSHRHCRLLKTQQYLLSELPGVPCFSNNDIVIEPHVIGT